MKNLLILLACFIAIPAGANPTLPKLFGNHMVLQRGKPVPVWGWADAGEAITVRFAGQEKKCKADESGAWRVELDALDTLFEGGDFVVTGNSTVTFTNVLVGEVWVCSGQSNMEWGVRSAMDFAGTQDGANLPLIRHIQVPKTNSGSPQKDFNGSWKVCAPDTVGSFTAVGYFFAKRLHEELKIPIGLVHSSWGGTRIEPWTPLAGWRKIESVDFAKNIIKRLEEADPTSAAGKLKYAEGITNIRKWATEAEAKLARGEHPGEPPKMPSTGGGGDPARLYNGMIHPLIPAAIGGAIWYQGESNGGEGETYYHKMHALVKGWRELFKQDFPFYFVQLANFQNDQNKPEGGYGYAKIRDWQRKAQDIPKTGMAVIIDIGETKDIHPRNKQDVGKRLAQWALAKDYGKKIPPCGPLYAKHEIDGAKVRIYFDAVGGGLIVASKDKLNPVVEQKDGKLARFAIAGEDKKWVWADAVIEGETVVVSSPEVDIPVAVRYAYSGNPLGANLYNREGIPASPFRTDDW